MTRSSLKYGSYLLILSGYILSLLLSIGFLSYLLYGLSDPYRAAYIMVYLRPEALVGEITDIDYSGILEISDIYALILSSRTPDKTKIESDSDLSVDSIKRDIH
jgi:hypothetical protein